MAMAEGRRARDGRRRGRKWEEWWTAAADRERPGARRGAATEGEGKEAMVGMARAPSPWGEDRRAREQRCSLYIYFFFNAGFVCKG
jgi:hypothetical protein